MFEAITASDSVEAILPDPFQPGASPAGLPTSLIVAGLEDQLAKAAVGYTPADFLSPLLDARRLLLDRYAGDADIIAEVNASFYKIMARIVDVIQRELDVDFSQFGLEPGEADYPSDVLELYRFFVVDRMRNIHELVSQLVKLDRRRLSDRYRKVVEKRNQTVAEARRTFLNFDDVVIWVSMPSIVADMREYEEWINLSGVLMHLEADGTTFLERASYSWLDESFAAKYIKPVFASAPSSIALVTKLQTRWMNESPKKPLTTTE